MYHWPMLLPPLRQAGNIFNLARPIKCAPVIRSSFAKRRSRPSIMKFTISCRRTAANAFRMTRTTTTKCFCSPYYRSSDKYRKRRNSTSGYRCNKFWPWRYVLRMICNDNSDALTINNLQIKTLQIGTREYASPYKKMISLLSFSLIMLWKQTMISSIQCTHNIFLNFRIRVIFIFRLHFD